jgi:hypothetical protein
VREISFEGGGASPLESALLAIYTSTQQCCNDKMNNETDMVHIIILI